jgi:hypothetical protein
MYICIHIYIYIYIYTYAYICVYMHIHTDRRRNRNIQTLMRIIAPSHTLILPIKRRYITHTRATNSQQESAEVQRLKRIIAELKKGGAVHEDEDPANADSDQVLHRTPDSYISCAYSHTYRAHTRIHIVRILAYISCAYSHTYRARTPTNEALRYGFFASLLQYSCCCFCLSLPVCMLFLFVTACMYVADDCARSAASRAAVPFAHSKHSDVKDVLGFACYCQPCQGYGHNHPCMQMGTTIHAFQNRFDG